MRKWIMARAKEPSTWSGFGSLVVAMGLASAGQVDAVFAVVSALASAVAVIKGEGG